MKPTPATAHALTSARETSEPSLAPLVDEFARRAPAVTAAQWDRVHARCAALDPAVAELIAGARAADGGKHMRPRLVAAAFLGLGGTHDALLSEVAGAQQLLHLGLCMHDDIIDGDRVRHGEPNLIAQYADAGRRAGLSERSAERQALTAGVLAGDLAINAAMLALLGAPAPAAVQQSLAAEASAALELTIAGELLDVRSELLAPDESDPLRVAELKTAAYSVALPLRLGAIASGAATTTRLDCLGQIGIAFGIGYQLADDELGLFGSADATGKSVLSDVRQGKRTEHVRIAYRQADAADRAVLDATLGDPAATEADAAAVRDIVTRTGARAEVSRTIDEHVSRGIRLAEAGLPDGLAAYLTALARSLRGRTS
ncbi:polyprenyl synthetase family protein [Agromyces laixinhei]|uniref:polyprenyl synthetase family protein n=1 Tax=Agromyces laixinhei TaxID=2585717 RepID=UPI001116BE2B|nr:polyprenyl synthetase family protein [Agromyces laixinhei]